MVNVITLYVERWLLDIWQWLFQNLYKCQIKSVCIQSHHFMANGWRKNGNSDRLFWGVPKSLWTLIAALKLKDICSLEEELWQTSVQFSHSVLCNPMDCSTPGFPVHHQLPKFAQTHVHWVGDAIQPSHPLSSPSPPTFNLPQIRVFSIESVLHIRWPKYWSFSLNISPSNEYSGLISFRMDWLDLLAVQGSCLLNSFFTHDKIW